MSPIHRYPAKITVNAAEYVPGDFFHANIIRYTNFLSQVPGGGHLYNIPTNQQHQYTNQLVTIFDLPTAQGTNPSTGCTRFCWAQKIAKHGPNQRESYTHPRPTQTMETQARSAMLACFQLFFCELGRVSHPATVGGRTFRGKRF